MRLRVDDLMGSMDLMDMRRMEARCGFGLAVSRHTRGASRWKARWRGAKKESCVYRLGEKEAGEASWGLPLSAWRDILIAYEGRNIRFFIAICLSDLHRGFSSYL